MNQPNSTTSLKFTGYQIYIVALLTLLQFTIILDFMVLSPLGAQLMTELSITPRQFGWVVSAYAFSAGTSGLLAAGFADKFDRKKLLLFFYTGFILGTLLCGVVNTYEMLLGARIVTGLFGGVIGSISFAIITDLFPMQMRGRVMGFIQMAFASSQILGIPIGLYLASKIGWHSPFLMIVGVSIIIGVTIVFRMKPIVEHLKLKSSGNPFQHLTKTLSTPNYLKGFLAIALLATGGFMLMPFGSAFSVHNLGLSIDDLPSIYLVTGICSMIFGPLAGKLSDRLGKYTVFFVGSTISLVVIGIYCNMGVTPLWLVMVINSVLFVGITSRMVSSSALMTAIPEPQDRGAFMSIQSSVQQFSGGIASAVAGLIVVQKESGYLEHYDTLGYIVIVSILITLSMMYFINLMVKAKFAVKKEMKAEPAVVV
jgi:predicted MFS family arabinose efflux permease